MAGMRDAGRLDEAARKQGIEVHGEVVDGGAAGFGDVLGTGAGLGVEEGGGVADFDAYFGANLDDTVAGGDRGDDGIKIVVDADFRAFFVLGRGGAGPAVGMTDGKRGHPDIVFGEVGAVVAGAVALAEFFHVDDAGFQTNSRAKIENAGMAKFVFGIDAVDGHAWPNHVEEGVRVLEEAEAGSGVLFAEDEAVFFERGAGFVEAAELLSVEIGIFGEGHHGALDVRRFAGSEIANQRSRLVVRDADTADASVDADVDGNGLLGFGGDFVERGAKGRVKHGQDVAGHGVCEILFVEWAEKKNGLANARVAEGDGFVKLDDREAEDFGLRFEELGDVGDTHAVAVVFDDRENGARGNAAGNFGDVVAEVFAMDFDPWIEGGVFRSSGFRRLRSCDE